MLLARDRTGKKPLFYTFDGTRLTFASEMKAILTCPWVERRITVGQIPELLTFGYVHTPRTLYEGILQVPPAPYVVLDHTGLTGPHRYWHLTFPLGVTWHQLVRAGGGQARAQTPDRGRCPSPHR